MKTELFSGGLVLILGALSASAEMVHLYERVSVDNETYEISDRLLEASWTYQTQPAPEVKDHYFIGWTISTDQEFAPRDLWGRAYDAAPLTLYENTTITAHYMPSKIDDDADGLPDGWERYWFGDLQSASWGGDYDKDNRTDGDEFIMGSNPVLPEAMGTAIVRGDSRLLLYNPSNYLACSFSCSPEGSLFNESVQYLRPYTKVETVAYEPDESGFSCWEVNGVQQRDIWGVAMSGLSFEMPNESVAIVAKVVVGDEDDDGLPDNWEVFWFGSTDRYCALDDPDGDGHTNGDEFAAKTNPVMAEHDLSDRVMCGKGPLLVYNPLGRQRFEVSSDPEGLLVESSGDYVLPGTKIVTPVCDVNSSPFVYWTVNGVVQRDMFGRALDSASFVVMSNSIKAVAHIEEDWVTRMCLYWYGMEVVDMQSDSDGDGVAFIDELNAGTNPLLAEGKYGSSISYADSVVQEANLQPYEQLQGAIVDGQYMQLFTSPVAGNFDESETFANGSQIWPVVADVNNDGLWDLLVVAEQTVRVFVNVGTIANPEFTENRDCDLTGVDLQMNSTAKIDALGLDVFPEGALSATEWQGGTLLVSDVDGRIWFYSNGVLQHKVWGGSYSGFAKGLRLAALDWEGDGDVDCLCGTAEGKLMLLRNPNIGRPTNLKAKTGVDNVLLEWDPNEQSRVRGYRIFRNDAKAVDAGDMVGESNLPRYRDWPSVIKDYDYRVSAYGRFYKTGSSYPIIVESPLADSVRAELGKVALFWNDAKVFAGEEVQVSLSVENSLSLSGSGLALTVRYDPSLLKPRSVQKSGLADDIVIEDAGANGVWTISASGGEMAAGGGTMFTFIFDVSDKITTTNITGVGLVKASLKSIAGADIPAVMPHSDAIITVLPDATHTGDPTVVPPYGRGDLNGDGMLTKEDLQLMAQLMNGGQNKKWSQNQLDAGDYSGNRLLDQDDYKLMRDDFRAKGIVNGGEKMGVL